MHCKRVFGLLVSLVTAVVFVLPVCAQNTPATVELEVQKILTGDKPSAASTFTFELEAVDGAPMPQDNTVTITGEGTAKFGEITYDVPEDYCYTIREKQQTITGYTMDTTVYDVTVQVTTDDQGVLTAAVYMGKDGDTAKSEKAVFTNRYKAPDPGATPTATPTPTPLPTEEGGTTGGSTFTLPQTGDLSQPFVWVVLGLAALLILAVLVVKKQRERKSK